MQILIAEDDLTSRIMLEAVLIKYGYEVVSTKDGAEAWTAMQQKDAPRLLILDWMMPGMDGPSLCRKLRENKRNDALYIIFLTSKSDRQDVISGLDTGADDYITKPYDSEELRARVRVGQRMLELQSNLREKERLQGVLEMAGAVCHEINQPLQSVIGYTELMMMKLPKNDPNHRILMKINSGIERIGQLTRKIMEISQYKTKGYSSNKNTIVDIDGASTCIFSESPDKAKV
jgi:CheY-like chemotaxis protein